MTQSSSEQPTICMINGKPINFIECDWNVVEIGADRTSELLKRMDFLNPDCAVAFIEPQETDEGLNAWVALKEYFEIRYIPFVAVMNQEDVLTRRTIIADAVYSHPVDPEELQARIQDLIKRRQRILDHILVDPVTGVNNYRYLRAEVEKQLNDMKRSHETFSMVYIELDREFSGDDDLRHLLKQLLIDFLRTSIRPTDSLAHYCNGGWVMLLPKTVKEDAMKLMNRLAGKFAEMPLHTPNGLKYATFSSKVMDFVDAGKSVDECLAVMSFTELDPLVRSGLVLDGTLSGKEVSVRKLKVAIIDDDRLIREMLRHQLSDIGEHAFDVEVKAYADGEQFFDDPWHRQNERYLLIIDRIMPKMDGLELLSRIRSGYDRRRYLCFMLSSRSADTDISLAIRRGANDYMVKPFSIKELRARITRLIGGF